MATAFLAEGTKHGRKVALKVLRPELAAILGADRFVQEIKTTAQFQHPHILPLYDSRSVAAEGGNTEFQSHRAGGSGQISIMGEVADNMKYAIGHAEPSSLLLKIKHHAQAIFHLTQSLGIQRSGRLQQRISVNGSYSP